MRDDLGEASPLMQLTDVFVRAGETTILDGVSLAVHAGAPTALIGPNGSGKTTLLRLIMGLIEPADGLIERGGASSAIVFQKPVMLRRSVAGNVAFALTAAGYPPTNATVSSLLDQVGLTDLSDRPARRLSGGEQQRLAIARALARQPRLMLLDEATVSLDPAQAKIIEDLIATIAASGTKIILATHDLGQARRLAGDVVFLVKGRVVEHAPARSFFMSPATEAARRFLAGDLVL
jgi:tungstate transport system ATP-binding protein